MKQIAIKSVSDSFQIWHLNQYSLARTILKIVFVIRVHTFAIYFQLSVVLKINKHKVAITVSLDLPSLLFLARVSLPNWYVFCPALDDLVEF